jgi:cysteinyl-tRNA synthetase
MGELAQRYDREFRAALDDDLNISLALAQVRGFVSEAYKACRSLEGGHQACEQLHAWDRVLGVLEPESEASGTVRGAAREDTGPASEWVEGLLAERQQARARKDYAESDRIRDLLEDKGIVVKDTPQGPRWHRRDE